MARTLIRLALALLVVGSIVANPLGLAVVDRADPTGDASASEITVSCEMEDVLSTYTGCDVSFNDSGIEDLQDHLSVYTTAVSMEGQADNYLATFGNGVKSSKDIGWLIANNETAFSLQEGLTKAETKTEAKQAVKRFFTLKQKNHVNAWNTQVASLDALVNQSSTVSGTTISTNGQFWVPGWDWYAYDSPSIPYSVSDNHQLKFGTRNITLINGSTTTVREIGVRTKNYNSEYDKNNNVDDYAIRTLWFNPVTGGQLGNNKQETYGFNYKINETGSITARPPNSDYPVRTYINTEEWGYWNDQIENNSAEVVNQVDVFVENTYLDFESGEINVSDVLAQTNAMYRWQVDSTNENATFSDIVAGLAASGLSLPALNETGHMEITFTPNSLNGNLTATGMLASTAQPPNGTWQVGKTYDTANLSGGQTVIALSKDGTSEQYQVNSTSGILRVDAVYDRGGNQVNVSALTTSQLDFEVSNTSELQDLIISLGAADKEYESRQAGDGTTGTDGDDGDGGNPWWKGIVDAIAGAVEWVAGLVGLAGLVKNLGPAMLVGVVVVGLLAVRIAFGVVVP